VVLGGSVAGMLAARALADFATEVVVVERDDVSGGPGARRGVPQGRHLHGLLVRGLDEIEGAFPGFTAELIAAGAPPGDIGIDCHWHVGGVRKPAVAGGHGITCTRPFLEWHLRRRLAAVPGVRVVRARATALTASAGRVAGVLLAGDDGEDRVPADLVVDCTGRSSRLDAWLGALGYGPVPERTVAVDLGYATRFFRRLPDERLAGALTVMSLPAAGGVQRGAAAFAVEDHRWMVMLSGYAGDRPGPDPADYAGRLAGDPVESLHHFASHAEPVTDVAVYRFPGSVRRDFDTMRLPGGLIAAGDAVASFNPIYGQGMTSAALHAAALTAYLASGASPHDPAQGYFQHLRKTLDSIWRTSVTEDFRLPHVTGDRPRGLWLSQRVGDLYTRATLRDADLHGLFLQVLNLRKEPQSLLRPGTVAKALRAARRPLPETVAAMPAG